MTLCASSINLLNRLTRTQRNIFTSLLKNVVKSTEEQSGEGLGARSGKVFSAGACLYELGVFTDMEDLKIPCYWGFYGSSIT